MISADTSTWVAFLQGDADEDTVLLEKALKDRQIVMPPVVLTELLSDPGLPSELAAAFLDVPLIQLTDGFWRRTGELRAKVLAKRHRARLGDALISQSCMDEGVPLITRDKDFQAFAKYAGLKIFPPS